MSASCPFCAIAASVSDSVLYQDELVVAFLDRQPIRPGHALVVPKMHEPDFFALPDHISTRLLQVAKRMARAQQSAFQPKRVGMLVAGFDIAHAHLHVVPMHDYHDITSKRMLDGVVRTASAADIEASMGKLRRQLSGGTDPC